MPIAFPEPTPTYGLGSGNLKFPKHGDDVPGCEWITVTAQGVPAHIGAQGEDLFAEFLPPPVRAGKAGKPEFLRAVVFVTEQTPKGTPRSGQEYVSPLLVVTGEAYTKASFEDGTAGDA